MLVECKRCWEEFRGITPRMDTRFPAHCDRCHGTGFHRPMFSEISLIAAGIVDTRERVYNAIQKAPDFERIHPRPGFRDPDSAIDCFADGALDAELYWSDRIRRGDY